MKKPVIGMDFGNFNSFTCFISDFDVGTRMGGDVHDLLPAGLNDGIPSVFFYSQKRGILCGEDATARIARPIRNRMRYLKRHLGQTFVLDGKTLSYDEAITAVIQHCIRRANQKLSSGWHVTSNLISLSYPAAYTSAQRQRLIELAEKATLEDGTPVSVQGTIAEPAAAALDYLAEFADSTEATTVLVYDLGGGTFDLALVSVYPKGRRNANGGTYYYDIINTRGISELGGKEFDEVMFNILSRKMGVSLNQDQRDRLLVEAESAKKDLSSSTTGVAEAELAYESGYLEAEVTKEEFEAEARPLLMRTINAVKGILSDHQNQQPAYILLTGGASQMPMVQKELEKALPQFRGKVMSHRPSRAIAYGAARFGTSEMNTDPVHAASDVQQRIMYDLGVRLLEGPENEQFFIDTYIKAGTPIPCSSRWEGSETAVEGQRYSRLPVYESKKEFPDIHKVDEDYTEIMDVTIDHHAEVPKGTESESRLLIDKFGRLTIEARDRNMSNEQPVTNSVKLKNLS